MKNLKVKMPYINPLLNILIRSLRSLGKKLVRDFNEIEKIQSSVNGSKDFANKTYKKVTRDLENSLREIKPNYLIRNFDLRNNDKKVRDFWFINPLNGFLNFSHGIPHFCIVVAIIENMKTSASAIYDPIKDEMFYSAIGKGCYLNDSRIRVSSRGRLNECIVGIDYKAEENNISIKIEEKIKKNITYLRATGCTSLDMCYLACGRYEAFIQNKYINSMLYAENLIVKEAGGIINEHTTNEKILISTNIASNNQLLEIINRI